MKSKYLQHAVQCIQKHVVGQNKGIAIHRDSELGHLILRSRQLPYNHHVITMKPSEMLVASFQEEFAGCELCVKCYAMLTMCTKYANSRPHHHIQSQILNLVVCPITRHDACLVGNVFLDARRTNTIFRRVSPNSGRSSTFFSSLAQQGIGTIR